MIITLSPADMLEAIQRHLKEKGIERQIDQDQIMYHENERGGTIVRHIAFIEVYVDGVYKRKDSLPF